MKYYAYFDNFDEISFTIGIEWRDKKMVYRILDRIKRETSDILGDNLVGVYVHGSIAFGCFNWANSDIDYVVVAFAPLKLAEKRSLMESVIWINQAAPPKGLEMSVILKEYCTHFTHPAPFELHFSNAHLTWYRNNPDEYLEKMRGTDPDLAAHVTVINHKGIALIGAPIKDVFSPVDARFYLDSIKLDIEGCREDIMKNPVYVALNLCRALAFVEEELVLSKREGGLWALKRLPEEYHALVESALRSYASDALMEMHKSTAERFCDEMVRLIFKPKNRS